jgi:hypothetical protein
MAAGSSFSQKFIVDESSFLPSCSTEACCELLAVLPSSGPIQSAFGDEECATRWGERQGSSSEPCSLPLAAVVAIVAVPFWRPNASEFAELESRRVSMSNELVGIAVAPSQETASNDGYAPVNGTELGLTKTMLCPVG